MTKSLPWNDDARWCVTATESDLPEFCPYQIGNGRIGMRVGPLLLDWSGDAKPLLCEDGPDFWGRLNRNFLHTIGKHVYDGGDQMIFPAWNQARLEIGGVEYREDSGRHSFRNILDLRTGEASCEDSWEYKPGHTVTIRVRLVVPRGATPCAAWYELSLTNLPEPARLRFGLNAGQITDTLSSSEFPREHNTIVARHVTRRQSRHLAQGLRWEATGWQETGFATGPSSAWVTLTSEGPDAALAVIQSTHCSVDGAAPERRAAADLDALSADGRAGASETNQKRWREIWANGLHFQHPNSSWEHLVLISQFHLLVSLEESGGYPMGPLGLSRPGWHGSQMWDADFWLFRAMLPLWPDFARNLIAFRLANIEPARAHAASQGLRGSFYTMCTSDEGVSLNRPPYTQEIHINSWIGRAVWEAAGSPPDRSYLAEVGWPLLQGAADFYVSRGERDPDGSWHLRNILPPDESVGEGPRTSTGYCDDNVLTNTSARDVLRYAIEAARILGKTAPPEWSEVADHLFIPPKDAGGIYPEYAGYNGHIIKQADLILALYPWQLATDKETVLRNVEYYHGKTDRGGPLMTTQIEALLMMQHGERERGLEHMFKEYVRYVRGPHSIPFETPENANSIMLTGIGGLLQALIFGWYGADIHNPASVPKIGDGWKTEN
jgi:trehalose/maltose hydrolase-like predicted phosphorylase